MSPAEVAALIENFQSKIDSVSQSLEAFKEYHEKRSMERDKFLDFQFKTLTKGSEITVEKITDMDRRCFTREQEHSWIRQMQKETEEEGKKKKSLWNDRIFQFIQAVFLLLLGFVLGHWKEIKEAVFR